MTHEELTQIVTNLLNAGWTPQEIDERLKHVRARHQQNPDEADQQNPDHLLKEHRLKFVRWLVEHGRLSDSL